MRESATCTSLTWCFGKQHLVTSQRGETELRLKITCIKAEREFKSEAMRQRDGQSEMPAASVLLLSLQEVTL